MFTYLINNRFIVLQFINLIKFFINRLFLPSVRSGFEDRLNLPVNDSEEEEDDNEIVTKPSGSKDKFFSNDLQKSSSAKNSNQTHVNKFIKMEGGHPYFI